MYCINTCSHRPTQTPAEIGGEKLEKLRGKEQKENKVQFGPQDLKSQTKTVSHCHWLKIIVISHWAEYSSKT